MGTGFGTGSENLAGFKGMSELCHFSMSSFSQSGMVLCIVCLAHLSLDSFMQIKGVVT